MKPCSYCGRANPDNATHCCGCGTEYVVLDSPPQAPKILERTEETVEPESDVPPEGEATLCTCCLFPNLPDSRWCKRCGAPMSSTIGIVMPDAAMAAGFIYRRAVEARPKLAVVLGIWLHFLPGFLSSVLALWVIRNRGMDTWPSLAYFFLAIVVGTLCGSMIWRVTRNYLIMRKPQLDD